jgi:hypothetical protein
MAGDSVLTGGKEWHACHKLNTVSVRCITRCRLLRPQTFPNFPVFSAFTFLALHPQSSQDCGGFGEKALPPSGWRMEFLLSLVTCPADFHFSTNSCSRLQFPVASSRGSRQMLGFCGPTARRINPADQKDSTATTGALLGVIDPSAVSEIVPNVVRHSTVLVFTASTIIRRYAVTRYVCSGTQPHLQRRLRCQKRAVKHQ